MVNKCQEQYAGNIFYSKYYRKRFPFSCNFAQLALQFLKEKAIGLSSPVGILWDSTAATPYSNASQDVTKGFVGSYYTNSSADVNDFFVLSNVSC